MSSLSKRLPHFYHVQPNPNAYSTEYRSALDKIQGNVRQLYSDSHLMHTKHVDDLIRDIGEKVAHLRLDDELLSGASAPWNTKFSERELVTQKQALLKTTQHLSDPGGQLVAQYRVNMNKGRLDCSNDPCACIELNKSSVADDDIGVGWTDTNVRAAENWAVNELNGLKQELKPLADAAQIRNRQYLDWLGITDRYNGYRNNMGYLGKPNPNVDVDTALDTNYRPAMAPRWNLGVEEERARAVDTTDYIAPEDVECEKLERMARKCLIKPASVDAVAAAGINRIFPGKTEYQEDYIYPPLNEIPSSTFKPPLNNRSVSEQPAGLRGRGSEVELDTERIRSKGYKINPIPDFLGYWQENESKPVSERISESHDRFKWPMCSEIRTCPWENR